MSGGTPADDAALRAALGASLLALRRARGWPLRQLAFKSGVPLACCSRAERGMGARRGNVARLAAAFGVTVDELSGARQ